ncbi:hemicentin-2-like [Bolinopsis microptera]|uniref:hemicentin-2-like n=1 Tax=Bolinopsis microptera TaxID=2820187 RepID=UPI00307A490C
MLWMLAFATLVTQGATTDGTDGETVAISTNPVIAHPVARDTQIVIICKYTTAEIKGTVKWMHLGQEFSATQKTAVTAAAAEGALSVSHYTIAKAALSDSGEYTCSAEYTTGAVVVTPAAPLNLQVIDVVMTMSSQAAAEGSKVTITCNFEQYTGSGAPTIEWFKDDTTFTSDQIAATSEGDNCGDVQRKRYIISSTATTDTGKYKCKATYTIDGKTVIVEPEPAEGKAFYVRKLSTTAKLFHVGVGASIEIVCTVNGDEAATFKWYTSTGADLDDTNFTIDTGTFADNVQTSTLKTAAASVPNHEASYKCKATWSTSEPKLLEDSVELKVQDVTGIKDATAITQTPGTELKITCQFEAGATKVSWYRSGVEVKEEVPTADQSELEYTIATVAGSDSGVYSCEVYYTGETITGRQTKSVKVRGQIDDATIYASAGTTSVTLTCVFYGDEMNTATWHKAGSAEAEIDVEGKTEVTPGTYSSETNSLTTTFKYLTVAAEDAAAYTCKTTYVSDSSPSQSVLTLSVFTNGKTTSDNEIVTTGDPFTLTCNHSPAPPGATATLQWKKDGQIIEGYSDSNYPVTSASLSDNGGYTCTVMYGSEYDSIESEKVVQKVRESEVGAAATHLLDGAASVTITCTFRGDEDFMSSPTTWSKAGVNLENGEKYTLTPGSKDTVSEYYERMDKLVILALTHDDEGDYTCNNAYTQTEKTQTLTVYTISSVTSTNDKVDAEGPFTLSCTHSAVSTGLQVLWTKDGAEIREGITVAAEGDKKSVLTVTTASKADNGVYRCAVTFGSYGQLHKEVTQNVRLTEVTVSSHYAINGAAEYVMTCTFHGDALSTTVWKVGDTVLTDDDEYDFSTSSPTASSRLDTLTINTVEAANSGTYKCSAQYTSGAQDASKDILLTVLGITEFVATGETETKVAYGSSVTFTCSFSAFPDGSPTVSWYQNDVIFPETLSGLITAPSDSQSLYTVAAADESNNGLFQCKVTFGDVGTSASDQVTRYVRHVTPSASIFGVLELNIDISCTFYGDALGATTWLKDSGAVVTGGQYTVTPGTYQLQMRTDTLTIATLTADNAGAFTCKAAYTDGGVETSSIQTLTVTDVQLVVAVTKDPVDSVVADATVTFVCTYTVKELGADDGTFQTAWTRNGEPLDSNIVIDKTTAGTESFQVTVPAVGGWELNGDYKCTVTYGVFGDVTAESPLLVRDIPDMSDYYVGMEKEASLHVMSGEVVSLTCRVYGDQPTTITWNDGAKDLTKADAEVTDSDYADQLVESVLVIPSATYLYNVVYQSYTCKADYTDPIGSKSSVVQLGVLNVLEQPTLTAATVTLAAKSTLTMTCTFTSIALARISAGTSQSVTVQLFKVGTETHVDESYVDSVEGYEVTSHDFVLSSVEPTVSGEYNCKATYGDAGHGSVTSPNLLIFVRAHSNDKTTEIITGSDVTLTCKFEGDEVGSTSWHAAGSGSPALVDDSVYDISVVAWEPVGKSLETTLTTKALTVTTAYTCKGIYIADSAEVESTQTVNVLAVEITSSEESFSLNAGTAFTLTCSYSVLSAGAITVEWFANSQPIDNSVEYAIENKADNHHSLLKFTAETATTEMNGVYKCKVTFGSVGSHEMEVTQYLLSAAVPAPNKYSTSGQSVILSCVFHGSLGTATSWYKGESSTAIVSDDVDFTVTAGVPTAYTRTDTLTVINADSADSAEYRCSNGDSEDTQELYVISIATNPTDTIAEVDKTTTMSCVTVETTLPAVDITWTSGSGDMENTEVQLSSAPGVTSGFKVFTSTLTITGVASVLSEVYTCVVQPPDQDTFKLTSTHASFYLTASI